MEKNNEIPNRVVQTYAEDLAEALEGDKSSGLVKKIIHQEEEHEIEKSKLSPEAKKNKFFMIASVLFIVFGIATLIYLLSNREIPTVAIEQQFTPIVFTDQSSFLEVKNFNRDKIIQTVFNKVHATEVKNGGVEGIYLAEDKQIIGLRRFITLIKGSLALPTSTIFVGDNFLMGAVNSGNGNTGGDGKDFFILIKSRSTADIFELLRAWETKMFTDLHGFFGIELSAETAMLTKKEWEDGIIENKNARVLYGEDRKIVMMYIFADDDSVIVTDSESAEHEIALRLAAGKIKK